MKDTEIIWIVSSMRAQERTVPRSDAFFDFNKLKDWVPGPAAWSYIFRKNFFIPYGHVFGFWNCKPGL